MRHWNRARDLAYDVMRTRNIEGWTVVIDTRPKVRAGHCRYRLREIGLSAWVLDLPEDKWGFVRNTVLHEVAHVLTRGDGHGFIWRATFRALGGNGKRCYNPDTEGISPQRRPYRWQAVCPDCGGVVKYRRRPKAGRILRHICRPGVLGAPLVWNPV